MKKTYGIILYLLGAITGLLYLEYTTAQENIKNYGSRNLSVELKDHVDRARMVLDTVEKKYITTNVPKPGPLPAPPECKCDGTGVITQPDGNKSQCQCANSLGGCKCKPKATPQEVQQ
jgi:hypothetical protein